MEDTNGALMNIQIIHGGQTGVDRGAHIAARAAGLDVAGYMPHDRRDEEGPIPESVQQYLVPCRWRGYATRTRANVDMCHAALLVVANRNTPNDSPGTALTLRELDAFPRPVPRMVVDLSCDVSTVVAWAHERVKDMAGGRLRLLVAGPRGSRWTDGENVAYEFVHALGAPRVTVIPPRVLP